MENPELKDRKSTILRVPITREDALALSVGDAVLIQGIIVTGRDRLHSYLFNEKPPAELIPFDLRGTVLYHCGPIAGKTRRGYRCVAAGPTTSLRVERYTAQIIADYGIRGIMGKGGMGAATLHALREYGCVYLQAIGGAAVYLADRVKQVVGVWKLEEFGMTEAMWILEVNDFPAIVTMDARGRSLHEAIERKSRAVFENLLKSPRKPQ
jgi:fumarate hydratase class I